MASVFAVLGALVPAISQAWPASPPMLVNSAHAETAALSWSTVSGRDWLEYADYCLRPTSRLTSQRRSSFHLDNPGDVVPKQNYHQARKQKELARKARQQAKQQRRAG